MRIMIADDQAKVRSALHLLLEQVAGINVVGEADGDVALIEGVAAIRPDAVLLDWELPGEEMTTLLPRLREIAPDLTVIAMSVRPDAARRALATGADAFVSKSDPPEVLLATLCAHNGKS